MAIRPVTQRQPSRNDGSDVDARIARAFPNRLNRSVAAASHAVDPVILPSRSEDYGTGALAAKPTLLDGKWPLIAVLSLADFDALMRGLWKHGRDRKEADYEAEERCES